MRAGPWIFALVGLLAVGGAALGLGRQHAQAGELRAEIARRRAAEGERARLEAENKTLLAAQPTPAQTEESAAKLVLAEQLRSQLADMRRRIATAASATPAATEKSAPALVGHLVAADAWRNAGRATPDAALETTLWAAAHGDIDALAESLVFDPETKRQATATFDRLPAVLQNELGTPERMIALLTASDMPLGGASILSQSPGQSDGARLTVQLVDTAGQARTSVFSLQAEDDRWRLKVPAAVVKRYAGWLGVPLEDGDSARR